MVAGDVDRLRLDAASPREEQLAGRLAIAPKFVFSASEVLTDSTRKRATQAWQRAPYDVYAATETLGIAAGCGHHRGMHLVEDLVVTEVVDEDNRPVPPGTFGAKVLVTVLFSRTLPLIRYEMSDSVQLASAHDCVCGRPYALIDRIQGRPQEALLFPTPDGGRRAVQPIVFHHVMDAVAAKAWQVVQHPESLEVLLVPAGSVDEAGLARGIGSALLARSVVAPRAPSERSPPSPAPPWARRH